MHFRLFHSTFIADLSGKWKLSRVLTPFVTGPEDRKSFRVIGTVFNVLYCLSIIIVCYLAYLMIDSAIIFNIARNYRNTIFLFGQGLEAHPALLSYFAWYRKQQL